MSDHTLLIKPDWTEDGGEQQYQGFCSCGNWQTHYASYIDSVRKEYRNHVLETADREQGLLR